MQACTSSSAVYRLHITLLCIIIAGAAASKAPQSDVTAAAAADTAPWLSVELSLDACSTAKPTLILISGVGGSQMVGTFAGSEDPPCPPVTNTTVMWFADSWVWGKQLRCWAHHMNVRFDAVTNRWRNSTGTQLFPDYGELFGAFPQKSKQAMFYTLMLRHLFKQHGYVPGRDFYVIPFDWRIGVQGLEQTGGLQRIADDISRAVKANCGKKAIVISHSYGANVMASIFQKPEFAEWRSSTVSGWIPIGGPFGGSAATPWMVMLAGDFLKLFPLASNLLSPQVWHPRPTVIGKSIYKFAFGLPSWGWMLPREGVLGIDQTIISTPTKNYTVLEQKQLLLDMGDVDGAALLDDSWQRSEKILQHGPIDGLDTFCLYSTGVTTPVRLVFNETIPKQQAISRPVEIIWTGGDGVVDLNSLRQCSKLTSPDRVVEVHGPLVDHASILSHPQGLHALDSILYKLGVPHPRNPLTQLVNSITLP